jgi:hypothetical protein
LKPWKNHGTCGCAASGLDFARISTRQSFERKPKRRNNARLVSRRFSDI